MKDSLYAYMQPGLVHFKAYPEVMQGRGYADTLEKICEDDFWTAVELGPVKDVRERDRARKMLAVSGLTVCYATQPTVLPQKLNPHHFDAAERARVLRIIKNCVDEAYQLGASFFRVMSGKDPGDERREEAKKIFEDFLHQICDYVGANGDMRVTLKVFDRDIDKKALIGTFSDTRDVSRPVATSVCSPTCRTSRCCAKIPNKRFNWSRNSSCISISETAWSSETIFFTGICSRASACPVVRSTHRRYATISGCCWTMGC